MSKNILLIMTDQQRSDYYGKFAEGIADMPNLDEICRSSYFTNCNTNNPICTPARTSLITGRYPRQIGTLSMSGDLFPQIPTFMQALQKNGYTTYGVGKFHYTQTYSWSTRRGKGMNAVAIEEHTKKYGYDHIWETAGKQQLITSNCFYAKYLDEKGILEDVRDFMEQSGGKNGDTADHNYDKASAWAFNEEDYIDVVTGRMAREYLKAHNTDKPFYMKVSFCGPHKPYDAPQRYLDMFPLEREDNFVLEEDQKLTEDQKKTIYRQRRSSKAMLKLIDDQIGEIIDLLKQKNMYEDTLIVFTSDHGDMLGDHFMIQKGVPWKQALNIPLAIKAPGIKKLGKIDALAEISDIAATILNFAGLDPQKALSAEWPDYNDIIPSRSLLPILRGETDRIREYCFAETDFTEERAPGMTDEEKMENRGGKGRSNAWQCIIDKKFKYIKYLGYKYGEEPVEELYNTESDTEERHNLIDKREYYEQLKKARYQLMYTLDNYPAAQKTWADKVGLEE